jgi:glycosyltransferase involved in cell wall biosynthesis
MNQQDGGRVDLTVFLPAWNESGAIGEAVRATDGVLRAMSRDGAIDAYEIVVVNDGSTDGTRDVLEDLVAEVPELRPIHHRVNRGVGPAIRTAMAASRGDLVFYTDADLPIDMGELPRIVELQRRTGADVVAGYRATRTHESPRRRVYSVVYNALVRVALGLRVRDVNFAAKLLTAEAVEAIDLRSESIFIDAEILSRADRAGLRIVEMPLEYRLRRTGESTTSSMSQIRRLLAEMVRLVPEIRRSGPAPAADAPN